MAGLGTAGLLFMASSLCLALPQITQADNCGIRVERVAVSGSANLSCAALAGQERYVTLHKEGRLIHNTTFREQNAVVDVDKNMRLWVEGRAVVYELRQVTDREAGLYTCVLERIYPPPFKKETRIIALLTVGHISEVATNQTGEELHPSSAPQRPPVVFPQAQDQTKTLWVACMGLALVCVVLVVFILVLGVRHKLRKNTEDSEYINTRPGEPRKPNRVQHPKWVHA